MSVYKWNSKIDYLEKAKTLAFNGEIEFLPESLVGLDLSHYYDDYPDLKELIGEKQYIDFNDSEQQQKVYDFIQNNSTLSDMVYADWLHNEASSMEDQLACELENENGEHLDSVLSEAHLRGNAVVGIYNHEKIFFRKNLRGMDLINDPYSPHICFECKNPLYTKGSDALEYLETHLNIESIEFDDLHGLSIDITAKDNHTDVNIEIVPFKFLEKYMAEKPEFKKDLKSFLKDYPEIQDSIEVYNIDLEQKNSLHR